MVTVYTFTCLLFIMCCTNGSDSDRWKKMSPFTGTMPKNTWNRALRQGNPIPETEEGPQNKQCICSKIYDPVCASNDNSYYNVCQMECENGTENMTVVHQGNCIPF
ncbi:serine protease inhibitor dipetalogastin-like [Galleria mellonella]|uniref:Serine protease inhibitor dipetalogastin-like n=1 Tax=Galleria mellonella TaxID=7137 RepID=A0A6J3C0D0_GALME|nr:serine protease inhibitor dipetalogastin-like [Galleria mellonella]